MVWDGELTFLWLSEQSLLDMVWLCVTSSMPFFSTTILLRSVFKDLMQEVSWPGVDIMSKNAVVSNPTSVTFSTFAVRLRSLSPSHLRLQILSYWLSGGGGPHQNSAQFLGPLMNAWVLLIQMHRNWLIVRMIKNFSFWYKVPKGKTTLKHLASPATRLSMAATKKGNWAAFPASIARWCRKYNIQFLNLYLWDHLLFLFCNSIKLKYD